MAKETKSVIQKKKATAAGKNFVKLKKIEKGKNTKKNTDPIYVGIDHSFTGTGVVLLDKGGEILEQKLIKSNPKQTIEERLIDLKEQLSFIPVIVNLKRVCIEGPSYGSNGQFILQMGALHFIIRILLFENNVDYEIITPGALKKFVTGKGNAKKELMLLKVYKKWGVEFSDNNMSDAYGLARMALEEK